MKGVKVVNPGSMGVFDVMDFAHASGKLEERDGLVWKQVLITGEFPGNEVVPPLYFTREFFESIKTAFDARVLPHVDVPVGTHEVDAVDKNCGFVEALEIRDDDSLWAGIRFTDTDIEKRVREGSIVNASVRLVHGFTDPITGITWPVVLWHVALTNKPVLKDLKPFLAFSLSNGMQVSGYKTGQQEVRLPMKDDQKPNGAPTAGETEGSRTVAQPAAAGKPQDGVLTLSQADLKRLQDEARQAAFEEAEKRYKPQIEGLQTQVQQAQSVATLSQQELHRANVRQILLALQGKGEHEAVQMPAGYAFAPTIIQQARTILEADVGRKKVMKLSLGDKGEKEVSPTDIVLDLLNAVGTAKDGAVVSLAQHGVQDHKPHGKAESTSKEKDTAVDEYLKERNLA